MRSNLTALYTINSVCLLIIVFTATLLNSCASKNPPVDPILKKQFETAEILNITGKTDSAQKIIHHIRATVKPSNPIICDYYCWVVRANMSNPGKMNLYADSALAFFNSESRKANYPNEYFQSLIAKGDACLKYKKYITSLNYYFKAKRILFNTNCDDGILASKMGGIYYDQKNYMLAAKYWAESYNKLENCDKIRNPLSLFYSKQGALNNAGFSYERAGMLDSAIYYYQKDLDIIDKADRGNLIPKQNIAATKAVVYDNLGGANLKQGKLIEAQSYLTKCIAVPNHTDGAHIPPLLKLAGLYMKLGQLKDADLALTQCRALLDKFYADAPEYLITWNKLNSEYLFKLKQPDKAFIYQSNYIRLRDSIDNSSSDLYKLDVERELNTMQQQNDLSDLEQRNEIKVTYLVGTGIIALLSLVIIFLINRNLKRIQKNHRDATLYNQQLQKTLAELELVNKNYIRIMRVMAHDLRNPLSGMTGLAALLIDEDEFSDDHKHMLRLIETTGTHSMEMINELLKSGLADENEQVITQKLDLRSLLFDSVELLQFKANDKRQQLIFESEDETIMAEVNHEKIWRVFNNIIVNAIKFSYEAGIIRVGIKRDVKNILISIADSGVGIPDADKNNVFEMFTPAKKAGTNGEQPFGLGLSISKKIVENHNGKIWFESAAGIGTTFYIQLQGLV